MNLCKYSAFAAINGNIISYSFLLSLFNRALSGILYLPRQRLYDAIIDPFIPSTLLCELRESIINEKSATTTFPTQIKGAIKQVFIQYKGNQNDVEAIARLMIIAIQAKNNRSVFFIILYLISL